MPKPVLEELRQLAASQAPGHACQSVLRWRDAFGQDDAVAVLERDHEIVRVAYRWRKGEKWRSTRLELTLRVAGTATGGVYRMWTCLPKVREGRETHVRGSWRRIRVSALCEGVQSEPERK